jgi:hypothetical protein
MKPQSIICEGTDRTKKIAGKFTVAGKALNVTALQGHNKGVTFCTEVNKKSYINTAYK